MTAINAFIKREKAILMTDAAFYTPEGLVVGFGQKAFALPAMKAAVAVRGAIQAGPFLAAELSIAFRSMDQLAVAGPAYFPKIMELMRNFIPDARGHFAQVFVVGWSDLRNQAVGYVWEAMPGGDTFQEIDEWFIGAPTSDEEDANLRTIGCLLDVNLTVEQLHPVYHGIPIMEAERRCKDFAVGMADEGDPDAEIHMVGGHILLTEVSRNGVQQIVLREWPDVLGENIQPQPFTAIPAATMQRTVGEINRANRRRMQKLARKHA